MADDSLRMAQVLSSNGLKEGQNFGICGFNNYEFITTLFGGLIVGGVAVPINGDTSLGIKNKKSWDFLNNKNFNLYFFRANFDNYWGEKNQIYDNHYS